MRNRPFTLIAAALVVALQGLVAFGLGAFVGFLTLTEGTDNIPGEVFQIVFGLALGIGLLVVARGILQAERWTRGPAITVQLFIAPIAFFMLQNAMYAPGIPLTASAVIVLLTLLSPPSTRAIAEAEGDPESKPTP
ncbi:hypothetical protein [Bailinhaonella thermotolerans]|uniref:Integral membrane protein n=1 Tax=Bailinhaonella thermotolerans TaxID=1070861 RepID=A0A3A4A818_9ACTN|nr:hypothetical protein [Bailinhaonella thermotolerans]RJL25176.1 hypothetical protein D5H75_28000 [Bailinhaonella thermotolerans]